MEESQRERSSSVFCQLRVWSATIAFEESPTLLGLR